MLLDIFPYLDIVFHSEELENNLEDGEREACDHKNNVVLEEDLFHLVHVVVRVELSHDGESLLGLVRFRDP